MYPTVEEVQKFAGSDEYKRIPVRKEMEMDNLTPSAALQTLRAVSQNCFLFESAEKGKWSRYSFLGCRPLLKLTAENGRAALSKNHGEERFEKFAVTEELNAEHPGTVIRKILAEYKSPKVKDMPPLSGGLVGYFSYDYIKYAEPLLNFDTDLDNPHLDVELMLFDQLVVFDNLNQTIQLITGVALDNVQESYREAAEKLQEMETLIRNGMKADIPSLSLHSEITPSFSKEEFVEMVGTAKEYIQAGEVSQVVLSNPLTVEAEGSLFGTYQVLRETNPSPYMFYFLSDEIEVAGASPETLAKLEDGSLFSYPLAGTRPRGRNNEEDLRLEKDLLNDKKELAEHKMLVDLARSDLEKIAKTGSVAVERYMDIHRYSHVMHIGSEVKAKISSDKDGVDAIDAILPAGTLSGFPKVRACQIINELEQQPRGIYGGAIGYIDFSGNLDTAIAIRLASKKDGKVTAQSGAGIVSDSVPETEYEECRNKTMAAIKAIKKASEATYRPVGG